MPFYGGAKAAQLFRIIKKNQLALSLSAPAAFLRSAPSLTDIAKKDREEDEPVSGSDQDDAQVHAEVEDLEDLRLGEGQHHDPSELGQGDAGEHL